ncbi:MAG: heme-binding protein [Gammaproteobacteria bacterium]|nr:heme-binding protein [Gammaproteobacteria bacterium]
MMMATRQMLQTLLKGLALCLVFPLIVEGQEEFAAPPQIPYGRPISLSDAKTVTAAAVEVAQNNGWLMAIAIVDTGGHLVYFEKLDGTQTGSVEVAIDKARSAALFRRPTKVFEDGVAQGGQGIRLLNLRGAVPLDGGIPIIVDGELIGGIGMSGGSGEQDGIAARAGAAAVE